MSMSNFRVGSGSGSGSGGLNTGQVQALIDESQRVLRSGTGGAAPTPVVGSLWVTGESVSYGHSQRYTPNPNQATYTEVTDSNWRGVYSSNTRFPASSNIGAIIYNIGANSFQRAGHQTFDGYGVYDWANIAPPSFATPWRGYWTTETEATAHVQADGDAVIYNNLLYTVDASSFVAGTGPVDVLSWQPVDEEVVVPTIDIYVWRNASTMGARPADATQLTTVEIDEMIPVSFATGGIYMHIDLPISHELDVVYIAGRDRFSRFTARTTTTRRIYDSAQLGTSAALDILIRLQEAS